MSGYQRISPGDGNHVQDLNEETSVRGYRRHVLKTFMYVLLNVVCIGIPELLGRWYPQWRVILTCTRCSLNTAEIVLVKVS